MTQNQDPRPSTPMALAGLRAGVDVGGYRLLRRLGAGGMGVVWEVADAEGRRVAMKILHPQIAADPMARRRLDREASVLARVRDSRVARILDIETGDGADGSGVTFVITELVDGPTLQHEVDHEGAYDLTVDARDLADLAHGLVDALSAVHAAGVIHRDLKPSNVMLGAQGPVLIDFGIAQVADDVRLTQTGQVTGTPGFIPPEMLDGGEPDPGVDWYACAGVLLFAVTGRAPFGSGPWQAVFRRVYAGTPELGSLEEEWPALARAFTSTLAPEAADRLPVSDLLAVLDDIAEGGTGEEVIAGLLGDDATLDELKTFDEARTDTGTYQMGYGSVVGRPPSWTPSAPSGSSGAGAGTAGSAGSAGSGSYGYLSGPSPHTPPAFAPGAHRAAPVEPSPPAFAPSGSQPVFQPAPPAVGASPAGPQTGPHTGPQSAYAVAPVLSPAGSPAVLSPAGSPGTGGLPYGGSPGTGPVYVPSAGRAGAGGQLPSWAREPQRHPLAVLSLALLLISLGLWVPVWMAIIATVLIVVAGTAGRADDARRWRRLEAGRVAPGDNSRMWAAMPWYLLGSVVSTAFSIIIAMVVVIATLYFGMNALGLQSMSAEPVIGASLNYYHRAGLMMSLMTAEFLLTTWFVPWVVATRRGGAVLVRVLTRSDQIRLVITMALLAAALGIVVLFALGALPVSTFSPLSFG